MNALLVFCFGACVGSFLNVCIYRLPVGQSVVTPRSRCKCGKLIPSYNNIPILSWLLLRGKAACCGTKISVRYLVVEFLTACLFLAAYHQTVSLSHFLIACIFISLLIVVAFIDIDTMEICNCLSIGGTFLGMLISFVFPNWGGVGSAQMSLINSIAGVCFGSGLLLWIAIFGEFVFKKEAIGFGDVKLMGVIGAFLGWQGCLFAIFGGCLISSIVLLPILFFLKCFGKSRRLPREVPFAPFLVTGSTVYLLFGEWALSVFFPGICPMP